MYPEIDDRDNCDQNKSISGYIKFTDIIIAITILLGLYAISIYSYVLFHSLVEIFGIIVIVSISIIVLHSRRLIDNNYYIFVGIAYLFIAVMTLLHTLAYKGMGVFIGYDANLPTQLWIATRYLESLTFLVAPLFIGRKLKINTIFSGYAIVTGFLIVSIFYWNIFPDCFIEGVGLTAFKKVSEYVISLVLLFSIYLLFQKRSNFDKKVLNLLIVALMLNVFAELAFTFYISVYGASNLIGHFFRLISFYLIYKAIIETALTKPYNLLFRSLKQSEMSFQSSSNFVQTIINSIGDPTIVIDASNYKILLANDAAQNFNNCKNPVENSMACYQFSHQRDAPCSTHDHPCPLQQVVNTKESQRVIHTHHDKKGNKSIVDIVATPIFDKNGEVIQMIESTRDITEIKTTEKVLRETRDYLEKVIECTNAPFIMWDPEFKITRVNHAFEHLTGYCSEELTYKKLNILFPDSSLQETMNEIDRTLVGENWESVEIPILRKDGSIRLTLWNSANLYDEDDKTVLAIIAQGIDITERKEAEALVMKERGQLQQYLDIAGVMIVVIDRDQIVTLINKKGAEILGYGEDEIIGKNWFDNFISPSIKDIVKGDYVKLMDGDIEPVEYFENIVVAKDNTERTIAWHNALLRDDNGIISSILSSGQDITEQIISQKRVQDEKDFSASLIQFSAFPLFVIDPEHKVLYWNKACEELTGVKSEDMIGTSDHGKVFYDFERPCVADIIISKNMDDFKKYYLNHSSSKLIPNGLHAESWFQNLGGNKRYVIFDAAPIENNEGKLIAVVESLQDITGIKLIEKKLKKYAEKLEHSNELKDMFTDILRHDLLNPAGIIKGYTEVLLGMENNENKLNALQKIKQNNEKLIDIVESAAKYAKLESTDELEFNVDDIGTIIKDVVEDFKPMLYEKQITLDLATEGEYLANINPMIKEVFANLFSNAIKFSPTKSKIIVDIIDNSKKWKVTITDFGEGISDENKPNVFTRFKRVGKGSVKGTGLGLAIVKKIVELHGGEVGVEDNPVGQGSVFWVTLNKA